MKVRSQFWSSAWYCLLIASAVALIWWPRSNMVVALLAESRPNVVNAVLFSVILLSAYLATRLGAGEFDDLRASDHVESRPIAWLVSARDLRALCYVVGFVVASLPILALALAISEVNVAGVGLVLSAALVQSMLFIAIGGFAGQIGRGDLRLTRYVSFASFVIAFGLTSAYSSSASWTLTAMTEMDNDALTSSTSFSRLGVFVAWHGAGALLINGCVGWSRWRRAGAHEREVSVG